MDETAQLPVCINLEEYRGFKFLEPGVIAGDGIELTLARLMPADVDKQLVPAYGFDILLAGYKTKIGRIDFRVCLTPALLKFGGHIGYEIEEEHRGRHYAGKAFRLLLPFIRKHGLSKLLITCGTNNPASMKTCEFVGARLVKIEETLTDQNVMRPTCYFFLDLS